MANRYVWSGATGTGAGTSWTDAYTTLAAAATASGGGDVIRVAHDHAEANAAAADVALNFATNAATVTYVVCVDRTTDLPAETATYAVTTNFALAVGSGSNVVYGIIAFYGINFSIGAGATAKNIRLGSSGNFNAQKLIAERCTFTISNTSTSSRLNPTAGPSGMDTQMVNCGLSFANASQNIAGTGTGRLSIFNDPTVPFLIPGTAAITTVFSSAPQQAGTIQGVDFTPASATATIFPAGSGTTKIQLIDCKIGASQVIAPTLTDITTIIELINTANTALSGGYRQQRRVYGGSLVEETTVLRTGGASDGTTAFSWKMVSSTGIGRLKSLDSFDGAIWNDVVGSPKTIALHLVTDNVQLTNADFSFEVDYLGVSGSPQKSSTTNRLSIAGQATGVGAANLASDTATWMTTGLTTPLKQKVELTFTPQVAGLIRWRVKLAKASTTVYVCPKVDIT